MKNWKIYIVTHKKIHDLTVKCDEDFNNTNYCFLNVGSNDCLDNQDDYCVIRQTDLENHVSIGKEWAESEGLYNLWLSGEYKKLDYIGCIHYDVKLKMSDRFVLGSRTNITKRIERYIRNKDRAHISFASFTTKFDFGQSIMMDPLYPNECVGNGRNCYYSIVEDYNEFFHTDYSVEDILKRKKINLCSCFLIDTLGFDRMMSFFDWVYKSHKLDMYDTNHEYRFQGGMAERYFGVFLLFEYKKMKEINLIHLWDAGWK